MLEQLTDVGFAFAILAFIGFLLKDAYNAGKYLEIPNTKKSSLEVIFHYCAISVLALSVVIGFIFPIVSRIPEIQSDTNTLNFLTILFALAMFYVVGWLVATIIGLYMRYFSFNFVYVTYHNEGNQITEKFPSVLIVDDDYVYFEKFERNCWKCLPKGNILQMETKIESETRFRLAVVEKLPWVKEYNLYIKILLIISMIVFMIVVSIQFVILAIVAAIVMIICTLLL